MTMTFYLLEQDDRKREFVAVRMESQLFTALRQEADRRGEDLSQTIRSLCSESLKKQGDVYARSN